MNVSPLSIFWVASEIEVFMNPSEVVVFSHCYNQNELKQQSKKTQIHYFIFLKSFPSHIILLVVYKILYYFNKCNQDGIVGIIYGNIWLYQSKRPKSVSQKYFIELAFRQKSLHICEWTRKRFASADRIMDHHRWTFTESSDILVSCPASIALRRIAALAACLSSVDCGVKV